MMAREWLDSEWMFWVRVSVKVGLVVALLYLGYHLYERNRIANLTLGREEQPRVKLHKDLFAFIPKSYVSDLESAKRKLVGMPLWIKEGYHWSYQPGGQLFEPLERIVPRAVVVRDSGVALVFDKNGREAYILVGSPERVFVDDIFFIKDPREIYDFWTEQMWQQVESHEVEAGMSEIQISFALGVGQVVRQSPSTALRIVEYTACREAGLQPVRVTYQRYVAESIELIDP